MKNPNENIDITIQRMEKEIIKKNKTIWTSMWVIMLTSIVGLIGCLVCVALLMPEGIWQIALAVLITLLFLLPCFYALKLEVSIGAYECKECKQIIIPTYMQALRAMHMGTTRHLNCHVCGRKTWCRKVINDATLYELNNEK